jgi:hypothetical protein
MKFLGMGSPSMQAPPPVPVLNQAVADRTAEDQTLMARGRATTILTSQNGLPNLGATSSPVAK